MKYILILLFLGVCWGQDNWQGAYIKPHYQSSSHKQVTLNKELELDKNYFKIMYYAAEKDSIYNPYMPKGEKWIKWNPGDIIYRYVPKSDKLQAIENKLGKLQKILDNKGIKK